MMTRLFAILALLLGPALGRSEPLPEHAPSNLGVEEAKTLLDSVEKQLGDARARLDELEPQVDDLTGSVRKGRYGGSSSPEVSGSYGVMSRNIAGYQLLDKNGVAMVAKMDLSLNKRFDDGSSLEIGFGPVFTPGAFPQWVVDDTDEVHRGNGTASRLGTLLGTLKANYHRGIVSGTAGFQSFQLSSFTLSGRLSSRPVVFDKNPYMINTTTKAYYENQFLTGIPKRAPEESEHYIMGLRTDIEMPWDSTLMLFGSPAEGSYDNDSMPREYGGMLTVNKKDSWGGKYKLIGFNRSNDTPEMVDRGADPQKVFFGLMNNTVFSLAFDQSIGRLQTTGEVANADYDDTTGVHVQGLAWRIAAEQPLGESALRLGAYSMAAGYLVDDPQHKYSNNGANIPIYRNDPDSKSGGIIHQTNVGDPTIPINDTTTYNLGGQVRVGNAFLNLNLQNSAEIDPTDSRIWSSHFLSGNNLNGSMWFVLFNNNYIGWLPVTGYDTSANGKYGRIEMEREFFYNPRRDPPAVAYQNTTFPMDAYNRRYSLNNATVSPIGFQASTIPDVNKKLYYNNTYRELEAGLWRVNQESILIVDPVTGKAAAPSVKNISHASADLRMNLADYIPFGRPVFWQAYSDVTTVNDGGLFMPSLDPNNLFVQSVADTTLVVNIIDPVNFMLYGGIENWVSDRTKFVIPAKSSAYGVAQNTTLEYHDSSVGAGFDWNAMPSKLNIYLRVKYLRHSDSFAQENGFIARMLELEMKSYF